jgi:hypothetical protein
MHKFLITCEQKDAKIEQGYIIFTSDGGPDEPTRPTESSNGLFAVHPNFVSVFFNLLHNVRGACQGRQRRALCCGCGGGLAAVAAIDTQALALHARLVGGGMGVGEDGCLVLQAE